MTELRERAPVIPIQLDRFVAHVSIPTDFSEAEASKIARVLMAFAKPDQGEK